MYVSFAKQGVNLLQENKTKTATSKPPTSRTSKRDVSKFTRRSEEEMQILIRAWYFFSQKLFLNVKLPLRVVFSTSFYYAYDSMNILFE